ncbi:right-handed parallel beta-helix repeat-containing protein [Pedobacter chinensis]|uniref:right-handed parallel beta-helix repeat-containing protein n=1 Tax=Pedobacter chinensis TaxID=2282421 RepID=UPI0013144D43|nr:right-handed parallel beta-helix repeat-containing protein [Pedobacter chinensis]
MCLRIFFCAVFILSFNFCVASTYYFSSISGNDSRSATDAQNPNTPWKSIEKLNAFFPSLKAGDVVSFKRNEVFSGSIILKASGISFTAYGTGINPIISALTTIKQWRAVGDGVYESTDALRSAIVNVLLINDAAQELGRYPNSNSANRGYLKIKSKTDNSITDSELGSAINWKGAEVVIRKTHWILDRHHITAQIGTTLVYDRSSSNYTPNDNYGYFIQNDQRTLDRFGEWYYNAGNGKMYVYFGDNSPSSYNVEVSTIDNIIVSNATDGVQSNISFQNISFKGANVNAFSLALGTNFSIKNCHIDFTGNTSINATDIKNLTVENCTISNSYNNAIALTERCTGAIIKGNVINKTMPFAGMSKSGDHNGIAIYATANNTLIDHNRITNTGYIGIYFGGENSHVRNNFVDNYCSVKDDGGGIYTFTGIINTNFTNRSITNNIITNGIGVKEGTTAENSSVVGIYLDDNVTGVNVLNNSISTVSDIGIFVHNARNNSITKNTVFDCGAQFSTAHDDLGNPITNLQVTDNIFFAKKSTQWVSKLTSKKNDIGSIGTLNNNYYQRPFDDDKVIHTQQFIHSPSYTSINYSLPDWSSQFKQDATSKRSPLSLPTYIFNKVIGTNRFSNGNFSSDITGPIFYGYGTSSSSWDNTNKLGAGGSIRLNSNALSYFFINIGAVSASKKYMLRFKAAGSKDATITAFLRHWNAPYETISTVSAFKLTKTTNIYECIFAFPIDEANTSVTIESDNGDFTYWLDDVEFYEADVTMTKPDDYIKFEYNASDATKSVILDGTYVDPKNVSYSKTVTLQPYSSIILMRTSALITPTAPLVTGNDDTNNLISTHNQYQNEIIVSENGREFKNYTDTIKVGNVARAVGYWKFKIKAVAGRNESAEVLSPAFTMATVTPILPKITADDIANTLTATHDQYSSEIVFSENSGSYQSYTGTINVGNVSRAAGYWKFKIRAAAGRGESAVASSPAFTKAITPGAPVLAADDVANTLSASHDTYAGDIVFSENGGAFRLYTGTINVGNVARPAGYWKFKLRTGTNHSESAVVPSPAFSVTGTSTSPTLTADDIANTLSATHDQYSSEIVFSENSGSYQSYTGTINVGNVSRAAGYWKFKIRAAAGRGESAVASSPAFTKAITPGAPVLAADDVANTLSASHDTYAGDIVFSENGGAFRLYTGTINVGNVARPAGYWKFKLRTGTNHSESAVVPSPAFSVTGTSTSPTLTADDTANTLTATHDQYSSEIVFSENSGSYQSYTGTINVGNVSRAAGYWKFKIRAAAGRSESAVASSPAFTKAITPSAPLLAADDVANTLSANHSDYPADIVVSENGGSYQRYNGTINVGNVARPAGYWKFKIKAGENRTESSVVLSPAYTIIQTPTPPSLFADDVANTLSATHNLYPNDIVVSENNGIFQPYTGIINVGNVSRPVGYWKFKIKAATGRMESAVMSSPAFTIPGIPSGPKVIADDIKNTLIATHELYRNDILVSENGKSYKLYAGTINVGNVNRAEGYWRFKIQSSANRAESEVIPSPAFSMSGETSPPKLIANNVSNTLVATHELYPEYIVYSENNGSFKLYDGAIVVGDVARPSGYWQFKIASGVNRKESITVNSPAFNGGSLQPKDQLFLYPNPVQTILHVKHPEVSNVGYIEVISTNGQKVKKVPVNIGSTLEEIDVSNLPMGTFILIFIDGMTKLAKTFIKIE